MNIYVIGDEYLSQGFNGIMLFSLTDPGGLSPFSASANNGYVGVDANNASTGPQILFVDGQIGYIWDTGSEYFTYNVILVDPAFPQTPY